jgi:signal transduction histidine kinase
MFNYDGWIGMILVIIGSFYLVKKIRLIPILIGIYLLASLVSMMTAGIISMILLIGVNAMFTGVWNSLLGNFMGLVLLIMLCKVAKKVNFQFDITTITLRGSLLFLMGSLSYGFYMSNFLTLRHLHSETPIGNLINLIALVVGFFSVFSVVISISKNNRLRIKEMRERHLEELLEQKNLYEEVEKKQNEEIRNFKHSINEHLISINELTRNNQLSAVSEYINDLVDNLAEIGMISEKSTGSSVIDANLHHLKLKYQYLDIDFKWEGLIPQGIKISNSNITDLFTNLLKNAFEAVAKVNGEKYISICIREDDQFLYINIKNNHNGVFKRHDGRFETMKTDKKNHGFGLKTVEDIVAKHGGEFEIMINEKEFEIEIIFRSNIYKNS